MTARDDLAALDREFNAPGATTHVSEWGAKRGEILARMYDERSAPPAPEPAPVAAVPAPAQAAASDEDAALNDPTPCTRGFLARFMGMLVQEIGKTIRKNDEKLLARIKGLETEVAELRGRPAMNYRGTWAPGEYAPGQFVTDHGSLFHANRTTRARPGESDDWTLAVKRGRDAR